MDYTKNPLEVAEIISSHRKEGKSNKEIAELLGITQKSGVTIVSRLQKVFQLKDEIIEFCRASGVTYQQLDRWVLRGKELEKINIEEFMAISGLAPVVNLEKKDNVVQIDTARAKYAVQAQSGPASSEYLLSTSDTKNDEYLKSTQDESLAGPSVQDQAKSDENPPMENHDEAVHAGRESVQSCTEDSKMDEDETLYKDRIDLRKMKTDVYLKSTYRAPLSEKAIKFLGNPRNLHSLFHHSLAALLLVASYYAIKDVGGELAIPMQIGVDVFFLYVWMYAKPSFKTYFARGLFTVFVAGSIVANPLMDLWTHYDKKNVVELGVKTGKGTVTKKQRDEEISHSQQLVKTYTRSLALVEQGKHPKQIKLKEESSKFQTWVREKKESRAYLYPERSKEGALKAKKLGELEASVAEFEEKLPDLLAKAENRSKAARDLVVGEFTSQEKMDMRELFLSSLKANGLIAGLRFLVLFAVIFMAVEVSREREIQA